MAVRVLIVEDKEALALLLCYNLEAEGYEVDSVSRGDQADVRLREQIPDLVVLDWMLPGLSGIELCRRIRARRETADVPVIMLTARTKESDRIRGLATEADDYIVKPFSVPELVARVQALLRRTKPCQIARVLIVSGIELDRERIVCTAVVRRFTWHRRESSKGSGSTRHATSRDRTPRRTTTARSRSNGSSASCTTRKVSAKVLSKGGITSI